MPSILESGKLRLSPEEADVYSPAAQRLHVACEIALDLAQPIGVDDWILLAVARAAIDGNFGPLDSVIGSVEAAIKSRKQPA